MKWHNLSCRDIPEARFQLMRRILEQGRLCTVPSGADRGQKRLAISALVKIESPGSEPLLPTHPSIPPPVDRDLLDEFVQAFLAGGEWKARPGRPFYSQFILPQMMYIVEILKDKANRDTTDLCMIMGSADKSLFEEDPWDLVIIDFLVEKAALHVSSYFRDLDVFKLFPLFVPALQILKREIALASKLKDGILTILSKAFFIERPDKKAAEVEVGLC